MKLIGTVQSGPYEGQRYWFVRLSKNFPRWIWVHLVSSRGDAVREVRIEHLEAK
jgi:hypothetical protein